MSDALLKLYIEHLKSLVKSNELLQESYVTLQGTEDRYIKGIIRGLEAALELAQTAQRAASDDGGNV